MKCVKCWYDKLTFNPSSKERQQGYKHCYVMSPYSSKGILLCEDCFENFESEERDLRQKYNLPV